jgi:glycosyltransferase involved in cell wall biosynthesis
MKIAILSFYSGQSDRGVETWAKNLSTKLGDIFDIKIISGENYKWENNNWFYHRWLILIHAILSIREWSDADVLIPANGTFQTLVCRLVSWIKRKPLIVFGHSGPGADDKWNLWCSPDVFVAFSTPQAVWANKFKLPWTKVIIIPHAVDTEVFFPSNIPKIHDVLCVAASSRDKRVDLVRKAASNLIVVGSGQELEVEHSKMPVIYNQSKVFCFVPQTWEAFGLVFLEAMACNLPVVTIDDPVRREIVGDAGIFVKNPENTKELANAIDLALKTDWGDKPRKQAEKFSWDKIAKQYENICNNNYQR